MTSSSSPRRRALLIAGAALAPVLTSAQAQAQTQALAQTQTQTQASQPATPAVANPADAPSPAGEIVVTARYRAESLTRVPIAITAISGAALTDHMLHNLQDLAEAVPTVDFRNGSSNKDRTVFIRGIGTISTSPGVEPSVSTVIDGVVLARPGQATFDLGEIDRVEVLRGPQGTLFGKNASAGVVSIVTPAPSTTLHGYGEAGATTDNEYRVTAGATGPLAENLAGRIDALYTHYDGNVRNFTTGDNVNGFERYGARAKLQFTPAANLKLTLAGDYLQSHDTVPNGVFTSTTQTAYPTGAVSNNAALAGYFSGLGLPLGPDNRLVTSSFDSDVHDKTYGTALTGVLDLASSYTVTTISAWRGWKNHQHQDYDQIGELAPGLYQGEDHGDLSSHQFSQELRLTSPKGRRIDYVVGAYYLYAQDDERYQRDITKVIAGVATPYEGIADYGTRGNNAALFGEANLNLTRRFRAIAGYRSSWDTLSYYHQRTSTNDPGDTGRAGLDVTAIGAYHASTGSTSTRGDTVRAGLQFDVAPANQAYFTWSRGYKGPAFDAFFNMRTRDEITLAPETSSAFELGAKGAVLSHHITYAVDVFSTVFQNYQANFTDIVNGAPVTRLINAGRVGTRGVELDIGLHPIAGLSFDSAVAYDDAKILDFNCPPGTPNSCNVNGRPLPFAPRWKLYENAAYRFAVSASTKLELQSDVALKSATQYQLTEIANTIQPSYVVWNVSAALLRKPGWQLRAYVKNLTNTHYSDYLANGNIGGTVRFVPRDDARFAGFLIRKDF